MDRRCRGGEGEWRAVYSMDAVAIGAEPPTAGPAGSFTTYAAGVASINEHSTSASLTFHPLPRALTAL